MWQGWFVLVHAGIVEKEGRALTRSLCHSAGRENNSLMLSGTRGPAVLRLTHRNPPCGHYRRFGPVSADLLIRRSGITEGMRQILTTSDFREWLSSSRQPSLVTRLWFRFHLWRNSLPFDHDFEQKADAQLARLVGIIDAMTPTERENAGSVDAARQRRIARGAGVSVKRVRTALHWFATGRVRR
jgi:hypothetical protein